MVERELRRARERIAELEFELSSKTRQLEAVQRSLGSATPFSPPLTSYSTPSSRRSSAVEPMMRSPMPPLLPSSSSDSAISFQRRPPLQM